MSWISIQVSRLYSIYILYICMYCSYGIYLCFYICRGMPIWAGVIFGVLGLSFFFLPSPSFPLSFSPLLPPFSLSSTPNFERGWRNKLCPAAQKLTTQQYRRCHCCDVGRKHGEQWRYEENQPSSRRECHQVRRLVSLQEKNNLSWNDLLQTLYLEPHIIKVSSAIIIMIDRSSS